MGKYISTYIQSIIYKRGHWALKYYSKVYFTSILEKCNKICKNIVKFATRDEAKKKVGQVSSAGQLAFFEQTHNFCHRFGVKSSYEAFMAFI